MKYIIDTDPGIDDTIAIMLGVKNNLDVIGFTLATGNIETKKSAKNLKVIQDFLNTNIKMYKGRIKNKYNLNAEFAHGKDGLGYAIFPDNNKRKFEKKLAEDFIIKSSKKYKDNLTLVCLGPLTNLANAIQKDKNLYKRIKHVVIMGTTYNPKNNNYHEFNVNIDPKAAKTVLETPFEDIKIITHEIGVKSFIEKDYIESLKNSEKLLSRFLWLISQKYMEYCYEDYKIVGLGTPDPTTIASLIDPSIVTFKPCTAKITTNGEDKGKCQINLCEQSNIKVSVDLDLEKFRKIFKDTFN